MRKSLLVLLSLLASLTQTASAALPAVVGTTLTEIQNDALALIDLLWPVILAVMGAFVLIKLVKRGGSKI